MMLKLLVLALVAHSAFSATKETAYGKYIGEKENSLPFASRLTSPLEIGQTIHAVGTLTEKPKKSVPMKVDIDFQQGALKGSPIPAHFAIGLNEGLFSSGKLVYNTFKDGNFTQKDQKLSHGFKAGEEFDLRIRLLEGKFQVYANRKDIGKFDQKEPITGVDHININGNITKLRLFHYGGRNFPIPYTAVADLTPGKRLDISGVPTGKRFNVNLYRANKESALQLSVRFNEGAVVRNAMEKSVWGKEEREGKLPINKKEVFDLTIINEKFSYQILFNGKRFATFAHRGDPSDVKNLEVDGEVELHTVTINDA